MKTPEEILDAYRNGQVSMEEAVSELMESRCTNLGHTRVDHDRHFRTGAPEVIYGEGKTPEQIVSIAATLLEKGSNVLVTRMKEEAAEAFLRKFPDANYSATARVGSVIRFPAPIKEDTFIAIVSAGTSDMMVAEEAALTAEFLGSRVKRFYDCGVAGLHRLLGELEDLRRARVIVAVAGMEGALPSVLAGLVRSPVIAVPTSVGYGANLGGISTLLAMLNSCANGISVVNIDNGFGAGFNAHLINSL